MSRAPRFRTLLVAAIASTWICQLACPAPVGPSEDAGPADAAFTTVDAGMDAGLDASWGPDSGPTTWLSDTLLGVTDAGVRIEQVSYLSDGLVINGEVCRPSDQLRHPVIMSNHGGFSGLGGYGDPFCIGFGSLGYVVGESSYRGEDGSEGQVEVCLGEVRDVQNMMSILESQPYSDPARVAAIGGSHGGCITDKLAIQVPSLKAAVDFFGPSDLPALYAFWQSELANGEPPPCPPDAGTTCAFVHNQLITILDTATGGTPARSRKRTRSDRR
jgi:hypothetical protein